MKVFLGMVGCRLNQSEIEKLAFNLRAAGHHIVSKPENAEIAIVNTCTVTASAAADSRKMIRRIDRAGCQRIIATGCLSTVDPEQIQKLPSVTDLVPNREKEELVDRYIPDNQHVGGEVRFRKPLPGKNKRTRAFIKVQDGCDNHCAYCITRVARGKSRSISRTNIYKDVEFALDGGVKEIVLTGVNLGSWGHDLSDKDSLSDLIKDIFEKYTIPRLRLSSIEPWDINAALLDLLKHPSFCHHFHLPLQSGCDETLKRMGRKITTEQYRKLVDNIRAINHETAITTDIIVGFPGETEKEFEKSLAYLETIHFSGGHVFRYSPRPGTPANSFVNQINECVKKDRSRLISEVIRKSQAEFFEAQLGKEVNVLWERADKVGDDEFTLNGITGNYSPVFAKSKIDRNNEISDVKLLTVEGGKIAGQIINKIS
jgi:threonylcarbamoyladenosine tRNA methylthiotransferase MtaB